MRTTQFIGLKGVAKMKLVVLSKKSHCETCSCGYTFKKYPGRYVTEGMFGEEIILPGYEQTDGRGLVYEKVQASPWSSGPVIFTALEDESGYLLKDTLWTEEEMEEYL